MKRVAIIGSTGSIGKNTIDVLRDLCSDFEPYALAVCKNIDLLEKQIKECDPKNVCVWDSGAAHALKQRCTKGSPRVLCGEEGLLELVEDPLIDIYVFSLSGSNGIVPLLSAIKKGKRIAIANKEPLVIAGGLIRQEAARYGAEIIPIDSEHSAIFQCLQGHSTKEVENLVITASGGPFFSYAKERFKDITPQDALRHPKWEMGRKITVDSATMMNKALELIEATALFGIGQERIKILIHPEALVHSMVEFVDGTLLAQLSLADMRLPIQYALTFPERVPNRWPRVDFKQVNALHFFEPDVQKFPTIELGYWAAREGGTLPAVLNAVDEICVECFLDGKISFLKIMECLAKVMRQHTVIHHPGYKDIMAADAWAREEARRICSM
jgi:1-deoxy-D-xylulose-5-phosphate reductoisomerase